jgi:DNA-binding MarR family transcriptional regulator
MTADSPTEITSDDVQLASSLRIGIMRLARRLRSERTDETLTLSQISALSTLRKHGPLSPSALAEYERVQPPSMTRIITALEERRLVERKAHESDGRVSVIALSPEGIDILEQDRLRRNAWLATMLHSLSEEERVELRAAAPVIEKLGEN